MSDLESQMLKQSKEIDAIKLSKKQADKEKSEAMRKLKDNQIAWKEIYENIEHDLKSKASEHDAAESQLMTASEQVQDEDGSTSVNVVVDLNSENKENDLMINRDEIL